MSSALKEGEDELDAIIRREEEENKKRDAWLKDKAARDADEAEKRKVKEAQEHAKLEMIK